MKTYQGQEIRDADLLSPGTYALIDVDPPRGPNYWVLQTSYGRKNLSHEPCQRGWLGCTNNYNRRAYGCVTVYEDSIGRLRIKAAPDDALLEELGVTYEDYMKQARALEVGPTWWERNEPVTVSGWYYSDDGELAREFIWVGGVLIGGFCVKAKDLKEYERLRGLAMDAVR